MSHVDRHQLQSLPVPEREGHLTLQLLDLEQPLVDGVAHELLVVVFGVWGVLPLHLLE